MNIPAEVLPLAVGTALAILALTVVLAPLLTDTPSADDQLNATKTPNTHAEGTAVAALREIEFDKATGKLSDKDYDALRMMYTRDALAERIPRSTHPRRPARTRGRIFCASRVDG